MMIYNKGKEYPIKIMFFTLKILAILFSAIPLFQYFYDRFTNSVNVYYGKLYTVGIVLIILFVTFYLWASLPNRSINQYVYQVIEIVIFFALFVFAICVSGAEKSYYKFVFLFMIISYTIEYGMKTGIIIGTISSALVLAIDILFGGFKSVNVYFQNDLALSAMFVIVGWTLGFYVKMENSHIDRLTAYANLDGLTGLYNHRFFHQYLNDLTLKCRKDSRNLSLLFFDVDYFKSYNDMNGHQRGDELLRELADLVKTHLRSTDIFCRYGGDEFCVILPDTAKEAASDVARRLRETVSKHRFDGQTNLEENNLTISVGVSELDDDVDSYATLIDNADSALYRAKFLRRNRVEVYSSAFNQFSELNDDKTMEENLKSLKALITVINSRDTYTYKHVERVVDYCRIMSDFLGLDKEQKRCLIYGAYLHDLGKINVPKEILITERKLTADEWTELKRHPVDSAQIIGQIDGFGDTVPIVLQHHEKYDGTGYPNGLGGEDICFLARILTIVDSFDAMTNHRPYQKIKTFNEAFEEIERCKGSHFDPILADQFINMLKAQ